VVLDEEGLGRSNIVEENLTRTSPNSKGHAILEREGSNRRHPGYPEILKLSIRYKETQQQA
jgi:hypothetical protein